MAYGQIDSDKINTSVANTSIGAGNATRFKNRIINGDMRIDQRNAGASVTPTTTNTYTLDRWVTVLSQSSKFSVQQNAGAVTPPIGFTNYLGVTSLSAYTVGSSELFLINQRIEGLNASDLGWGTANAKTVTLSFWVRSSLTGTFGGSFKNSASDRSYPFSYTINSANTWERETITIVGDTSGTWLTTNGIGIQLSINLGSGSTVSGTAGSWQAGNLVSATGATSIVGTSGATFYITGVQLEVGESATGFEYVDYTTQLAMCQRYYEKSYATSAVPGSVNNAGLYYGSYNATYGTNLFTAYFAVEKRTAPTMTGYTSGGVVGNWYDTSAGNCVVTFASQSTRGGGAATLTGGSAGAQFGHWVASAEL